MTTSCRLLSTLIATILIAVLLRPATETAAEAQAAEEIAAEEEEEEEEEEESPPAEPAGTDETTGEDSLGTPGEQPSDDPEAARQAEVYDVVYLRADRGPARPVPIALYPEYLTFPLSAMKLRAEFEFRRRTQSGSVTQSALGRQIASITYYEQRMGQRAAEAVGLASFEELATPGKVVDLAGKSQGYQEAETRLLAAVAEHDSALQRGLRMGDAWSRKVRAPLVHALVNLRLSRVDQLIGQADYELAETECDRLAAELTGPGPRLLGVRQRYEKIFEARAGAALAADDYPAARALLERFADRAGGELGEAGGQCRQRLVGRATALVQKADQVQDAAPREALEYLDEAAAIWPALAGLDQRRRRLRGDYPILHCAYAELPGSLSPLDARTPVQRHAVSLIFESLVRWVDQSPLGSHWEPQLAERRLISLERGRGFYLPRCSWAGAGAEPAPCTVEDVRWTVKLLTDADRPGYCPAFSRLLDGVQNSPDNDPRVALLRLARDHWQPLSLMDFRIMRQPEASARQGLSEELARLRSRPVGTGPYRHVGGDDPQTARFVANPSYRAAGRPRIREIIFHRLEASRAVDAFLAGKIHLLYDVRPGDVTRLRNAGKEVRLLKTPAVWFLAPNFRREALGNRNLRLAIAHAVDRRRILDQCFRPEPGSPDHVALSGPYPRESWACNRAVTLFRRQDEAESIMEMEKAKTFAELARKQLAGSQSALELVYPDGNEAIRQACEQISSDVEAVGIELALVPVAGGEFHERVVGAHDFDLAYWRHDFEDPTYWLEPLFDQAPEARRPGGPNFMGYTQDQTIAGLFAEVHLHKHFPEIQATTHKIHESLAQNAVMIPLWQLGTYVAVSETLRRNGPDGKPIELEPFDLFGDVADWELEAEPPR